MTRSQALASADEIRALDADELGLADQTRPPLIGKLSDAELTQLIRRLRERRKRARDLADRQSREVRSKAAPSGATAVSDDAGMRSKHQFLGEAPDRAITEQERRAPDEDVTQADLARKAMELKAAGTTGGNAMVEDGSPLHPEDPDASSGKGGMAETARKIAPSGALDHAGDLQSRERSRTRY
jgi:hypothetical protein